MSAALALPQELRQQALIIARGFKKKLPANVLLEDLEQAAIVGAWRAHEKRDRCRDPKHLRYFSLKTIRGHILDELRAYDWLSRPLRRAQSRGEGSPLVVLHGDDTELRSQSGRGWENQLAGPAPRAADELVARDAIEQALLVLPPRELTIVRQHLRGRTFKSIADELGVSEPRITQLHARALRLMRKVLTEEEHDHRPADRRTRTRPPQDRSEDAEPTRVRARRLGRSAAPAAHRPVPAGAGVDPLAGEGGEGPLRARLEDRPAGAPARGTGGELTVTSSADAPETTPRAEPVPSVLPEEGIDLAAELERYRWWMINQALARTNGNVCAAGRLLGYTKGGGNLHQVLNYRAKGRSFRHGRPRASGAPAAAPAAPEPALVAAPPAPQEPASNTGKPAPHIAEQAPNVAGAAPNITPPAPNAARPVPRATDPAERLAARIDWSLVEQLRAEGLSERQVCQRLAWKLEAHRFTVEKALRLPRRKP